MPKCDTCGVDADRGLLSLEDEYYFTCDECLEKQTKNRSLKVNKMTKLSRREGLRKRIVETVNGIKENENHKMMAYMILGGSAFLLLVALALMLIGCSFNYQRDIRGSTIDDRDEAKPELTLDIPAVKL
jgi:hypothetical protein